MDQLQDVTAPQDNTIPRPHRSVGFKDAMHQNETPSRPDSPTGSTHSLNLSHSRQLKQDDPTSRGYRNASIGAGNYDGVGFRADAPAPAAIGGRVESMSENELRNGRRNSSNTFLTAKIDSEWVDDQEYGDDSSREVIILGTGGAGRVLEMRPGSSVQATRLSASGRGFAAANTAISPTDAPVANESRFGEIRTADTLVASRRSEVSTADGIGGTLFENANTNTNMGGISLSRRHRFTRAGSGRASVMRPHSGSSSTGFDPTISIDQQQQQWQEWYQLWALDPSQKGKSPAELGESPSLSFLNDAILNISEKTATDPSVAPSFTQLDLANLIDRSLERFNIAAREKMWKVLQKQHTEFQAFRQRYVEYLEQRRHYRDLIVEQEQHHERVVEYEQRVAEFKEQKRLLLQQQQHLREKIFEQQHKQPSKPPNVFDDVSSSGSGSRSNGSTPLPIPSESSDVQAEARIQEQLAQLKEPEPITPPQQIYAEPTPPEILTTPPARPISIPGVGIAGNDGEWVHPDDRFPDDPDADTESYSKATAIEAMAIKNKILGQIINELGRRVDRFQRHNTDLIQANMILIRDRNVARQARDDLHALLQEKNDLLAAYESGETAASTDCADDAPSPPHSTVSHTRPVIQNTSISSQSQSKNPQPKRKLRPGRIKPETRQIQYIEREFFDQENIISSALAQLQAQMAEMTSNDGKSIPDNATASFTADGDHNRRLDINPSGVGVGDESAESHAQAHNLDEGSDVIGTKFHERIDAEIIKYASEMASIKKQYDPPTPVGIGLKHMANSVDLLRSNPYRDVRTGRTTIASTTNYHPRRLQQLLARAKNHVDMITSMMVRQRHSLLEAKTPDQYVQILHQHLSETTAALHDSIDALAEEQKHARRWRGQCEIMARRLEQIRTIFDRERVVRAKFYAKRHACINALMPIARPSQQAIAPSAMMKSPEASTSAVAALMQANPNASNFAYMTKEGMSKMRALRDGNASLLLHQELLARIATAARAAAAAAFSATAAAVAANHYGNSSSGSISGADVGPGSEDAHHVADPQAVEMAVMTAAMTAAIEALEHRGGDVGSLAAAAAAAAAANTSGTRAGGPRDPGVTTLQPPWVPASMRSNTSASEMPGTTGGSTTQTNQSSSIDVLAGTIDERNLPPLPPHRIYVVPPPRESRMPHPPPQIEKVPVYVPLPHGMLISTGSLDHFDGTRPGTIGSISAFDYTPSTTPNQLHHAHPTPSKPLSFHKTRKHLEQLQLI